MYKRTHFYALVIGTFYHQPLISTFSIQHSKIWYLRILMICPFLLPKPDEMQVSIVVIHVKQIYFISVAGNILSKHLPSVFSSNQAIDNDVEVYQNMREELPTSNSGVLATRSPMPHRQKFIEQHAFIIYWLFEV